MKEEEGEQQNEKDEEEDNSVDLQLCLHAVWGRDGPQIMRVRGTCQRKTLRILIDMGSTHNFLSAKVADKVNVLCCRLLLCRGC